MNKKVVFLCTGNICRSPLAEGLARSMYSGLGIAFASAGLDAPPGRPASPGSLLFAAACGVDLGGHASRRVSAAVIEDAGWVIGMTRSHAALFRSRWAGGYGGRIGVLGAPGLDLAPLAHSPEVEEVADPYGQPDTAYRRTGRQIRRLLAAWETAFGQLAASEKG